MNTARALVIAAVVCLHGPAAGAAGDPAQSPASQPVVVQRIPVEVWRGGCCGPTLRLRDALEEAFDQASAFVHPAPQSAPDNLIVYIPQAVRLAEGGARYRAVYHIEFRAGSTTGRLLRSSKGSCWDDEMRACAARIVEDAKKVARKLR
jgi:hypothetical protein